MDKVKKLIIALAKKVDAADSALAVSEQKKFKEEARLISLQVTEELQ